MAIIGLGLLAGQHARQWLWPVPTFFMAGILIGFASLPYLTPMVVPSMMLLAVGCVCGVVVALSRTLPTAVVGIIAFVVGLSVGVDTALEPAPLNEVMVALLGPFSGATVLLVLSVELSMACQQDWQRLGVRIVGSWISASAMLIIAMVL